jgi:hypothetical protein
MFSGIETEVLGIKFQYQRLWKEKTDNHESGQALMTTCEREKITRRYEDVYISNPVKFSRTTLEDDYPLVLHFVDKKALMFFRNGASVIIFQDGETLGASVTWFQSDQFLWVRSRISEIDYDVIRQNLEAISKIISLKILKKDHDLYCATVATNTNQYDDLNEKHQQSKELSLEELRKQHRYR